VWNTLSSSGTREEEEEESARESLPSSPPLTPIIDDKAIFGIELKPGYGTATTSHPKHIEQDRIIMKELSSKKVFIRSLFLIVQGAFLILYIPALSYYCRVVSRV
jgi:hypothetical protein